MGFHPIHDIMAALDTTYRPCPACDGVNGTPLSAYSPADWSLVTCDTCDFVYLRDPPAYEDLVDDLAFDTGAGIVGILHLDPGRVRSSRESVT